MSVDAFAKNDPLRQQTLATITCCKYGQQGHYRKDFLIQLAQVHR